MTPSTHWLSGSTTLLLASTISLPSAAAQPNGLTLPASSGHVVSANINGASVRLKVTLEAHGFLILNEAAARRAGLGKRSSRSSMAIGPIRSKGRSSKGVLSIGGVDSRVAVRWYELPVDPAVDGVISPALLPYDWVRLDYGSRAGANSYRLPVRIGKDEGVHYALATGGRDIAVKFAPDRPYTFATGAAAALLAKERAGAIAGEPMRIEIGFGVSRPARWLTLARPVTIGFLSLGRLLMRTGDFLGDHDVPVGRVAEAGEIVVEGRGERQGAVYRMVLSRDVLGTCSDALFDRESRSITLRCD